MLYEVITGYLIFDQTEAMTTIDVNSGGFVASRNLEETIRITSYNVCYTKLLRSLSSAHRPGWPDNASSSIARRCRADANGAGRCGGMPAGSSLKFSSESLSLASLAALRWP